MSESLILSLSGDSSILEIHFFPPIELVDNKKYVVGLVELLTFNSIPNIDNKKFYVEGIEPIIIPTGSYEIEDIEVYLIEQLKLNNISFSLKANNDTLQSITKCDKNIDFTKEDSINDVLGFQAKVLEANELHVSALPISIIKINSLCVECNIIKGAYSNGYEVHTIHEFFPAVPPGFKIIEKPHEVIYLPININKIDYLQLWIVDQDRILVNFRGEIINIRIHIKAI